MLHPTRGLRTMVLALNLLVEPEVRFEQCSCYRVFGSACMFCSLGDYGTR